MNSVIFQAIWTQNLSDQINTSITLSYLKFDETAATCLASGLMSIAGHLRTLRMSSSTLNPAAFCQLNQAFGKLIALRSLYLDEVLDENTCCSDVARPCVRVRGLALQLPNLKQLEYLNLESIRVVSLCVPQHLVL